MSGSVSETEGTALRFTFIAADHKEVTLSLTRDLACESLYLQAALDAKESHGIVPVARGAVIELYVSYLHFRSLLRRLRRELQTANNSSSTQEDVRVDKEGNDNAASDNPLQLQKDTPVKPVAAATYDDNSWFTFSELQRLSRSAASYADAPLSCDGAGPQGLCELPAHALLTRYTTREAHLTTTSNSTSNNSEGHRCEVRTWRPSFGLSAPLAAAIETGPQSRAQTDTAYHEDISNDDDMDAVSEEEDDDDEDGFTLGGYALRDTLDDYADVFFIERVLLRRCPLRTHRTSPSGEDNDACATDASLTQREQQLLLELLTLADYVADQHLVRLCAHYFCCWLMRSTESDIIASVLPAANASRVKEDSAHSTCTLSHLLQSIPPGIAQGTQAEADIAPHLSPQQRLTLLQEIRRNNAAFVDPLQ